MFLMNFPFRYEVLGFILSSLCSYQCCLTHDRLGTMTALHGSNKNMRGVYILIPRLNRVDPFLTSSGHFFNINHSWPAILL